MTQPQNGEYRQVESQTDPAEQDSFRRGVFGGVDNDRDAVAAQERELRQGLKMGDDRALNQCGNWAAFEHQALYDQITNGNEPAVAYEQAALWTELGNDMAKSSQEMDQLIKATQHGWVGDGAEAARESTLRLAKWGGDAAQTSQYMGNRTNDLGLLAEDAKSRMPEPVKYDEKQMMLEGLKSGGLFGLAKAAVHDIPAKRAEADNAHENAIRVMQNNEAGSRHVDETTPVFTPPPEVKGPGPGPNPPIIIEERRPPEPPPKVQPPHIQQPPPKVTPPVVTPIPVPVRPTPPPVTPPRTIKPPVGKPPVVPPGCVGIDAGKPPPGVGKTDPTRVGGKPPVLPGQTGNLPPGQAGLSRTPGGIAPGGILGALTGDSKPPAGRTGFGPGGVAGAAPGASGATGVGTGAGANAAAAGARGPAGAPGLGGGPMGAGGKKEEDKEHKRADYLQETEDVWGDGSRVAPPVIGE
ncbi:hypothetical protein JOF53_004666 [Crossiella equi]|uniref:PPE domain-containing protein n=1 Tax=Crossiella equi TaxID=130796 RepID=A0ABS5AHU2_9PSEU|nr:PPE domain-containing protein [Crossiella equi]MBP2475794.1 hypothetical protein [Crossiella equi]